ncbi:sigma-70 family RNA polymerase sigma factor [Tardibacter chloracetimidivorans]|nr:sigma-70 family RNA polymerase sigma factor [Tardibacter chloracetimidivorans]
MGMLKWFGQRSVQQLPTLRRYARALVGDDRADDLVHEALVKAYDALHRFRPEGDLRSWLLAILHNCFVSDWRKRRTESGGIEHLKLHSVAHVPPSQEHAVQLGELTRAYATLSVDQRAVLHLVVVEGLSYEAAAIILDVPVGTVMSRLSRARAALRQPASDERPLRLVRGGNGPAE